jgi:3-deoxy-manno-octulosonate cytidylyltransferase (CMP-KDO synthetase)
MYRNKTIACVIPARLASTRFPQKMLSVLAGRPLLAWVWQAATSVPFFDDVCFAVDTPELAAVVESFGGRWEMTSITCPCGTDRLVELAARGKVKADVLVNWQGDEPFITLPMIEELLQGVDNSGADVWTLKKRITDPADITSRKLAKVVTDARGRALYFSRAPIPCFRDTPHIDYQLAQHIYYKHVGLYAFTPHALSIFGAAGQGVLEDIEKLEMLRFLEQGLAVQVFNTSYEVFGIDFPEDLARAEAILTQLPASLIDNQAI